MGKSRSATIIIAYLLWKSQRNQSSHAPEVPSFPITSRDATTAPTSDALTPKTALALLRQSRPSAEPNDGFMSQLYLYHSMSCPDSIDNQPKYQRWLYQNRVQESLDTNRAPELAYIRFEDEHKDDDDDDETAGTRKSELDIKCRKCRRLLARSPFLVEHKPPERSGREAGDCAHLFLHPLGWMRGALEKEELDGRLSCPNQKCGANVGKFAWQGMRCSCGGWVTPGFGLARGRVDEVAVLRGKECGDAAGAVGMRMPPGMRNEGGHL
jgi:dual specificity phosphatase 12